MLLPLSRKWTDGLDRYSGCLMFLLRIIFLVVFTVFAISLFDTYTSWYYSYGISTNGMLIKMPSDHSGDLVAFDTVTVTKHTHRYPDTTPSPVSVQSFPAFSNVHPSKGSAPVNTVKNVDIVSRVSSGVWKRPTRTKLPTMFPINVDNGRRPYWRRAEGVIPQPALATLPPAFAAAVSATLPPSFAALLVEGGVPPTPTPQASVQSTSAHSTPQPSISPLTNPSSLKTSVPPLPVPSFPRTNQVDPAQTRNTTITYRPGNLDHVEYGLLLSEGLTAKVVALAGHKVAYSNGETSSIPFHYRPDAGAAFVDERVENPGGWVYVSNSEIFFRGLGGVGALTFDKDANLIHYDMVLKGSTWNCGGGRTPWNTWVSCEEAPNGIIWQVDPFGLRQAQPITLGLDFGGRFESFAYDARNKSRPHFFVTEDFHQGATQRFTPDFVDWSNPWDILHGDGLIDYLFLIPNNQRNGGTFEWITNRTAARENAEQYYPNCEGMEAHENQLYFVCKKEKQLYELNLDDGTYKNGTTVGGLFDGEPDQIKRILGDHSDYELMYFTEEGGNDCGIHARDSDGNYITILESPFLVDETAGLAFSPDGKHLYVAYQLHGLLYDISRMDGFPFHGRTLDVKYHNAGGFY